MLKNNTFLTSILEGFGPRFGVVFGKFFGPKIYEICKNIILAKTLKLVIFPRENAYFQEIEDRKKYKNQAKIDEKSHVFLDVDFEGILDGFWKGFDRPQCLIFPFFSMFFRCKILIATWKGKKSKKKATKNFFPLF